MKIIKFLFLISAFLFLSTASFAGFAFVSYDVNVFDTTSTVSDATPDNLVLLDNGNYRLKD